MDLFSEKARRWRRSFDGYLSFRKTVALACIGFVCLLYLGPPIFSWLFGTSNFQRSPHSCVQSKVSNYDEEINSFRAHVNFHPPHLHQSDYLAYAGNGHIGLPVHGDRDSGHLFLFGRRHLNLPIPFKPLVHFTSDTMRRRNDESATVVSYNQGLVHSIQCPNANLDGEDWLGMSSVVYAHRGIPQILVQETKVFNPSNSAVTLSAERMGILDWPGAETRTKTIEHGDGNQKYIVVSGMVKSEFGTYKAVVIVMKKLDDVFEVGAGKTESLNLLTAIASSTEMTSSPTMDVNTRDSLEKEATDALLKAVSMTSASLRSAHSDIWEKLWKTGFGISHSMADNAINELQVNATMYYVLSQVPAPMHSSKSSKSAQNRLLSHLAYSEGCYAGHPTLFAPSLWRSLRTIEDVNSLVRIWMVTLEKNGCRNLLSVGADGAVQAMILSFLSFKFRQDHLELNAHPKDLHRDYHIRRLWYGNDTHLNISIVVQTDYKPVIQVAVDHKNMDYFACDAGCLDPPEKLRTIPKTFPVKLTDPVTAILYITSDHQHMDELKEAIHFKDVGVAPAHEHHVIALHRHGNKLGGLPGIFWFSLGLLIIVFHLFLFKLIWQEYCAGQDKFRTRKFSDYN